MSRIKVAAQRILEGVRWGEAEVRFPLVTRLAVIAAAVAPNVTASVLDLTGRLLPDAPADRRGRQPGRESQSAASPSWLARLGDAAARRYNQIAPSEGATT